LIPPPPSKYPPSSLLVANKDGTGVRILADLMAYELKNNPDGQIQFAADGTPFDALSNPFSMTYTKWGLLVADGGANDVLRVNPRTGKFRRSSSRRPRERRNACSRARRPTPARSAATRFRDIPQAGKIVQVSDRAFH
jgi:hypothetical protein